MYLGQLVNRILTKNALIIFIFLISLVSTAKLTLPNILILEEERAALREGLEEFVKEEDWVCGATSIDKSLSYQKTNESCRDVSHGINNCCAIHDVCYTFDKTQDECDTPFCKCLEEQGKKSRHEGCVDAMETFCWIVQLFGGIAHSNAKEKAANTTNENVTLLVPSTSNSIAVDTTPEAITIGTISTTTITPNEKLDITEKDCFTSELNECVIQFETCESHDKLELLQCEEQMCQCTRSALRNQARPECRYPIEMTCVIPDSISFLPIKNSEADVAFLWQEVVIFGYTLTVFTILMFIFIATFLLLLLCCICYQQYTRRRRAHFFISPSQTPLCAATSTDSGLGCASNGSSDTVSTYSGGGVQLVIQR